MDIKEISKYDDYMKWLDENRDIAVKYIKRNDIYLYNNDVDVSGELYDLIDSNYNFYLSEIIFYTKEDYERLFGANEADVNKIMSLKKEYLTQHKKAIYEFTEKRRDPLGFRRAILIAQDTLAPGGDECIRKEDDPSGGMSVYELINHPEYRSKTIEFLKERKPRLDEMGLSSRAINAFKSINKSTLDEIFEYYPHKLNSVKSIGEKTAEEIKKKIGNYLTQMEADIQGYCMGKRSVYDGELLRDKIMSFFLDIGFAGINYNRLIKALCQGVDDTAVKSCIDKLISEGDLRYADGNLYRVYPSIYDIAGEIYISDTAREITICKINGTTFEEIAQIRGSTRERSKILFGKNLKHIRKELKSRYGFNILEEDRFAYLYENYEFAGKLWCKHLSVPERTYNYLTQTLKHGSRPLSEALSDDNLDFDLRYKIKEYLNTTMLKIDGRYILKDRSEVEKYAISAICKDKMLFSDYFDRYNKLLKENGIEYDEDIYYAPETEMKSGMAVSQSRHCLWNQGEYLRYYDIAGHDYTDLIDALNLRVYRNVEISTLKLFNENPDIMKKYDIRDEYELHNLLKKILRAEDYNDLLFSRQPILAFGNFDRENAIRDIILALSPISEEGVVEYLYHEYGYDRETSLKKYLKPFRKFYVSGSYNMEFKRIPKDGAETLKKHLKNEFYYISEVRSIYCKYFVDADPEQINPASLKSLGYKVFPKFILRSCKCPEDYFGYMLMKRDALIIADLDRRYGALPQFQAKLREMKNDYDVLIKNESEYVNFRMVKRFMIKKSDFYEYCATIRDCVDEGDFFTFYSVRKCKVKNMRRFFRYNQPEFLEGLLLMDSGLSHSKMFGKNIFYKGGDKPIITQKSFILHLLSRYKRIHIDDLLDEFFDLYGITVGDRQEILTAICNTEYCYDDVTGMIYLGKDIVL